MKSGIISLLLTICFILAGTSAKAQNLVRPGTFSYNGTTFKVEVNTNNSNELIVFPINIPSSGENPSEIDGWDLYAVLATLEIQNNYNYTSLLPLFSNYKTLKKDGEFIRINTYINGHGDITMMYIYLIKQTKINQVDLAKFYQKVQLESKFQLKSRGNRHKAVNSIFYRKFLPFNPDIHMLTRSIN